MLSWFIVVAMILNPVYLEAASAMVIILVQLPSKFKSKFKLW